MSDTRGMLGAVVSSTIPSLPAGAGRTLMDSAIQEWLHFPAICS